MSWRTLERTISPAEATVLQSALAAAGFHARIGNYHISSIFPYLALAVGGYAIEVEETEFESARQFLAAMAEAPIAEVNDDDAYEAPEICPSCGGHDISRGGDALTGLISAVALAVPFSWRKGCRRCRTCGKQWAYRTDS